jgi:spore maturation protein SpmB
MVVMMILMRFLEACGVIDRIVQTFGPLLKPFGMTGLSVLAVVQITLVSFVAPLPTLALAETRGTSDRNLAAGLAAILAMAPANATFPLAANGVSAGATILISIIGGMIASASAFYLFGRRLANAAVPPTSVEAIMAARPSFLKVIEISGAEAVAIVIRIIPMLLLSLVFVAALDAVGFVTLLSAALSPIFVAVGLSTDLILPVLTKYLAGSTALVGLYHQIAQTGSVPSSLLGNGPIGFLLHPLDLPGVAILLSAGPRTSRVALPAIFGAVVGISLRTVIGIGWS